MPPLTPTVVIETVAAIGTVSSLFFYFLSSLGLASFLSERNKKLKQTPAPKNQLPAVSILKPLKGVDPQAWESFCSHCEQDYPQFQLIFGVSDPADPVVGLVHKLQAKYPALAIELIVCDRVLGTNIKVSNLVQMLPSARHEILLMNDSDIRVPKDYLRQVVAPLADASVGLVTCLYRGVASPTLGSRLEALGISTDFIPGVLSARPRSRWWFRSITRLSCRRLRTRLPHLVRRKASRTQRRNCQHISSRLHPAPVFPTSTTLVAHHPRRPTLGILRHDLHLRIALGAAGFIRRPRRSVGVDITGHDVGCAVGHWIRHGRNSIERQTISSQHFPAAAARPDRALHLGRKFCGKPHPLARR
jgi:hypothetical protein